MPKPTTDSFDQIHELQAENSRLRDEVQRLSSIVSLDEMALSTRLVTTERTLRQREHDLQSVLDNMPAMIGYWDRNLRNRFGNHAYKTWFGVDPARMPGMHIREVIGEERYRLNLPYIEAALRGEAQKFERTIPTPDGQQIRYSLAQYMPDIVEGEVHGFYVLVSDITAIKEAELALRSSEERYRSVVEDQTEVISRIRADGTLIFVNDVYCRLFGKTKSEFVGRRWHPVVHPDDIPDVEAQLRKLSPQHPIATIENRVYWDNGELHWMQFVNRGFFDAAGQLIEIQSVGRDITARKQAEVQLRISEERLRLVLDATGDALWDWDFRSGVAYLSPRYYELIGHDSGDVTPDFDFFKRTVHPDDLPHVLETMDAHMRGLIPISQFDYRLLTADGKTIWVNGIGLVVERDSAGAPLRMIGTISDISERKHAESTLRAAHDELERRVVARTEELRRVAVEATLAEERERQAIARDLHDDLGQILHVAKIKLDSLAKRLPAAAAETMELDALVSDASRMVRSLTSQLSPPVLKKLGLLPALQWLAEEMERQYDLTVDFSAVDLSSLPPLSSAQSAILFRATRELLINVVRHADTDQASIRLSECNGTLTLNVEDTGIGIADPQGDLDHATGFGLSSIRERLTFLGGGMEISNRREGGLRVSLFLPLPTRKHPATTAMESAP